MEDVYTLIFNKKKKQILFFFNFNIIPRGVSIVAAHFNRLLFDYCLVN